MKNNPIFPLRLRHHPGFHIIAWYHDPLFCIKDHCAKISKRSVKNRCYYTETINTQTEDCIAVLKSQNTMPHINPNFYYV